MSDYVDVPIIAHANRNFGRWGRAVVGAAVGVLVMLAVTTAPALAHATFESSDPAAGAVLEQAPEFVTLTFDESIEIGLGAIRVFDGAGQPIDVGPAEHPDGRGEDVRVRLPALGNGSYVVDWRVVSTDGHPVQGAFTFQVGPESSLQPGILDDIIGQSQQGRPAGIALAISRGLVIAAIAVVFGGLMTLAFGIVGASDRVRRVFLISSVVGAVVGMLQVPLEVGYATGRSLSVVVDADVWRSAFDTRLGTALLVRALLFVVAGLGLTLTAAKRSDTWWKVCVVVAAGAVGVASAYAGHGASGRWQVVGIAATTVHVVAMAAWLGGLTLVLIDFANTTDAAVRRFSNLAAASAAAVVVSGVIQAFRQLGSFDALTSSNYGTLLIWKVILVAAILAVAAISRRAVHANAGDADRPRLRRTIGVEVLIGIAVVVTTSLLMASDPSAVAGSEPFSATVVNGDYLASITVEPATVGTNEIHLYLSSAASSLDQPDDVMVQISDPSRDLAPIDVVMTLSGAGHYTGSNVIFPYAGSWTLTVLARYHEFDSVEFVTIVPIS